MKDALNDPQTALCLAGNMQEKRRTVAQKEIVFPQSVSHPEQPTNIVCKTSIIVVGANGSGKSRLGAWLETEGPQKTKIHRIAAQRSIFFLKILAPLI